MQADWQAVFPPHPATHWVPYSVQMKYGRVWENSEAFGDCPFPQMQSKVRVFYLISVTDRRINWTWNTHRITVVRLCSRRFSWKLQAEQWARCHLSLAP